MGKHVSRDRLDVDLPFKLVRVVVTALDADARQVRRRGRRIDPNGTKEPFLHQLRDAWAKREAVKATPDHLAKALAVHALRRSRHPKQPRLWLSLDDAVPLARDRMMRLVNDDEIEVRQFVQPSRERLDARNLDRKAT